MGSSIFLSAVSREFKSYRDQLAHSLTRRGFSVRVQEDFTVKDGSLLQKLDAYIQQCDSVICLIGKRFGWEPTRLEAEAFSNASSGRHSYTQWEFILAQHYGKRVYVFVPDSEAVLDSVYDEEDEPRLLQANFRETKIEAPGLDHWIFKDVSELKEEVLVIPELTPARLEPEVAETLDLSNPYIGLRRFEETDRHRFFGRTQVIRNLLEKCESTPLLTAFGNSGSGKSSVVRAGLIPAWRRIHPSGKVIVFTPDKNPFTGLMFGLAKAEFSQEFAQQASQPSETVFRDLIQARATHAPLRESESEPWFVFIDQFEEIITRSSESDARVVERFFDSLIEATNLEIPGRKLTIVLAIRDDFVGALRDYPSFHALADRNLFRITAPAYEELCEIVEIPAARNGVSFQPGLVPRITSHVEGQPGMLPLLQYTLELLWETEKDARGLKVARRISRDSYIAIDGVRGALKTKVAHFYREKSVDQRRAMRSILLTLVDITQTEQGFTRVSRSETRKRLLEVGGTESEKLLQELLDRERLLISGGGENDDPVIELAHEALIRGWDEFESWIDESQEAIQMRNRLTESHREWEKRLKAREFAQAREELWMGSKLARALELNQIPKGATQSDFGQIGGLGQEEVKFLAASGRETRAKARRLRVAVLMMSMITLLAVLAAVFAWGQSRIANREREGAEEQKLRAQIALGKGWLLRSEAAKLEGRDLEAMLYAARAVGFENLGKPESLLSANALHAEPQSQFQEVFDELASIIEGQKPEKRSIVPDLFPRLIPALEGQIESNTAYRRVLQSIIRPFNWQSPVTSQHFGPIICVAIHPNGKILATSSNNDSHFDAFGYIDPFADLGSSTTEHALIPPSIRLWDLETGELLREIPTSNHKIAALAWSLDGQFLASGAAEEIKFWNLSGDETEVLRAHSGEIIDSLTFTGDGKYLFSSSLSKTNRWNLETSFNEPIVDFPWSEKAIASPSGRLIGSSNRRDMLFLQDLQNGDYLFIDDDVSDFAFTSDELRIVTVGPEGIKIHSIGSSQASLHLRGEDESDFPTSCAINSDDTLLAIAMNRSPILEVWDLSQGTLLMTLEGHTEPALSLAWTPDGTTLVSGAQDNRARVWNIDRSKESVKTAPTPVGHSHHITSASFSPDGRFLASTSLDHTLIVWDIETGTSEQFVGKGHLIALSWSPDGKRLAFGSKNGIVEIFNLETKTRDRIEFPQDQPFAHLRALDWMPNPNLGNSILVSWDKKSVLVELEKNSFREFESISGPVKWSPDGEWIACYTAHNARRLPPIISPGFTIFDRNTGNTLVEIPNPGSEDGEPTAFSWSPIGLSLAIAYENGTIQIWDSTDQKTRPLALTSNEVVSLAWSPNGKLLAVGDEAGHVALWNLEGTAKRLASFTAHHGPVTSLSFGVDEKTLASGSIDHTVKIWTLGGPAPKHVFPKVAGGQVVGWKLSGKEVFTGSWGEPLRVWDLISGKAVSEFPKLENLDHYPSPDGRFVLLGSRIHDLKMGTTRQISGHYATWNSDGSLLAHVTQDGLMIESLLDLENTRTIPERGPDIADFTWSGTNDSLAIAKTTGEIRIWSVDGKLIREFPSEFEKPVTALAWNSEGHLAGTFENEVRLWNSDTGQLRGQWTEPDSIAYIQFSPNGQFLAAQTEDGPVVVWRMSDRARIADLGTEISLPFSIRKGDPFAPPLNHNLWSPDGKLLADSQENTHFWDTKPEPPSLYPLFTDGICNFDPKTEVLEWNLPRAHLYTTNSSELRDVPRNSFLGILQTLKAEPAEKNWRLYLKSLKAQNWRAAAIYRERLLPEERQRVHFTAIQAARTLATQIAEATHHQTTSAAIHKLDLARNIISPWEESDRNHFHEPLAFELSRLAKSGTLNYKQAARVLELAPDPAAKIAIRQAVSLEIWKRVADADTFREAHAAATTWMFPASPYDSLTPQHTAGILNATAEWKASETVTQARRDLVPILAKKLENEANPTPFALRVLAQNQTGQAALESWKQLLSGAEWTPSDISTALKTTLQSQNLSNCDGIIAAVAKVADEKAQLSIGEAMLKLSLPESEVSHLLNATSSPQKSWLKDAIKLALIDRQRRYDQEYWFFQNKEDILRDEGSRWWSDPPFSIFLELDEDLTAKYMKQYGTSSDPTEVQIAQMMTPRFKTMIEKAVDEDKANYLRILATTQSGPESLATYRKFLDEGFSSYWDFWSAGDLAFEHEGIESCRKICERGAKLFPDDAWRLHFGLGKNFATAQMEGEAFKRIPPFDR